MPRPILSSNSGETLHRKKRRSRKTIRRATSKCHDSQQKRTLPSPVVRREALLASLCQTLTKDTPDLCTLLGRILRAVVEELDAPAGTLVIEGNGKEAGIHLYYQLGRPEAEIANEVEISSVGHPELTETKTKSATVFPSGLTVVGAGKARFVFVPSPAVA